MKKKQTTYSTLDRSLKIGLDYNSKYVRRSFLFNAINEINSLKLQGKIVSSKSDYRRFVKEEIMKKYTNSNL